jgi:putative membrane protein
MSITRILSVAGAGALWIAAGVAFAQPQRGSASRTVLAAPDQRFLEQAAKAGYMSVELGKMGAEKATNPKVKELAQKVVDVHGKMNSELHALAKEKGLTLPATHAPDPAAARLSKMSGEAFDKAFMHQMTVEHQREITLYETESKSGVDADVKGFAAKQLPELRAHMDAMKAIQP